MKTKLALAITAIALVATALVSVAAAQYSSPQNATAANPACQTIPPYLDSTSTIPPNCINAITGTLYCYNNGTYSGYNQNGDCYGYGFDAQAQNQYQYQIGTGMMSRNSGGYGCCR
jgi:hypothetical protein